MFPELIEVIDSEPRSAAMNMAVDEALLREVVAPTLRVYQWRESAVSFGYFGRVAEVERMAAGRSLVRRWTGGGVVEHGEDVTYTLVVPREDAFLQLAAPESYRLIHEAIGRLLWGEGIAAEVVPGTEAATSGECFVSPVQYDLVVEGRKIAGGAQRRTRWGLLHQGSILMQEPVVGLGGKLAGVFGGDVRRGALTAGVLGEAEGLAESRYGTVEWLRKR